MWNKIPKLQAYFNPLILKCSLTYTNICTKMPFSSASNSVNKPLNPHSVRAKPYTWQNLSAAFEENHALNRKWIVTNVQSAMHLQLLCRMLPFRVARLACSGIMRILRSGNFVCTTGFRFADRISHSGRNVDMHFSRHELWFHWGFFLVKACMCCLVFFSLAISMICTINFNIV